MNLALFQPLTNKLIFDCIISIITSLALVPFLTLICTVISEIFYDQIYLSVTPPL